MGDLLRDGVAVAARIHIILDVNVVLDYNLITWGPAGGWCCRSGALAARLRLCCIIILYYNFITKGWGDLLGDGVAVAARIHILILLKF